jgi:16S rRNA C967 or C1407 C5-methylase (RsmB/RsmF family)
MSSSPPSPGEKFDFVLIDAECSTDGALNQVKHKIKAGKDTATDSIRDKLLEEESLTSLQLKLLSNGFANLKVGGSLVYSTCSLSENQNENVVRAFLSSHPDAYIANVDFEASTPPPSIPGSLPGTLRFQPTLGPTHLTQESFSGSGFFLCKITKGRQKSNEKCSAFS